MQEKVKKAEGVCSSQWKEKESKEKVVRRQATGTCIFLNRSSSNYESSCSESFNVVFFKCKIHYCDVKCNIVATRYPDAVHEHLTQGDAQSVQAAAL